LAALSAKLLERIKNGEADGILAWLPDRLSRNSIDSGQIIYMLDEGVLVDLKFPHFWFENTPQGKYMLANEFNSSKQYVDNLSVNTKRGLRAKVRAVICPRLAPLGYLNDIRRKIIIVDKRTFLTVRRAFELYAVGDKTLDDIAKFLFDNGIKTNPQPLCGLVRCANCGCFVTGAHKVKRQKNGNVHEYTYYRCSHRKCSVVCREPELREYALAGQLVNILRRFSMPANWGNFMLARLSEDELVNKNESDEAVASLRERLDEVGARIKRLFDVYLDGDVEQDDYRARRAELMSEKKSLECRIERVLTNAGFWIEPLRRWIMARFLSVRWTSRPNIQ
jgi:hypothetical protein